jgi:multidrug efflux pump subunit AcrB
VAALVILLLGLVTIYRMSTDIFPEVNIPVVGVVWSYGGVAPEEMEKRIATLTERAYTTTVNDIEHMESQSVPGVTAMKIFFQPGAKIEAAVAQLTSTSQSVLRAMPVGIFPPSIVRFSASSVPILQLSISSKSLSEEEVYDYSLNFVRTQLATVQGASTPMPYGGKYKQVMVDIDPQALYARRLSPNDIINAINAQNLILPAGVAKMGTREYMVRMNSSPDVMDALNDLPVQQVNNTTTYLRDVAQVRDGFAVQSNVVRQDGRRSVLITILKHAGSTLDIVARVKKALPRIQSTLPPELNLRPMFDQSLFVRASVNGVIKEAIIAAFLTAFMILLFLGSWRSTVIVAVSIPLSILVSIIVLNLLGETMNVMTLGGLALAVGILVDDATVEIENIHRNLGQAKPILRAILDGAQQIAVPAFVSTLAICIVFVPVVFLTGSVQSLFTPLAMAVVFAMMASYLLSRTLIPTMARYLLPAEIHRYRADGEQTGGSTGLFSRAHEAFNRQFDKMREGYRGTLAWALEHRLATTLGFAALTAGSLALVPFIGQDFFPMVDAGQFRLHVRAPAGTRIEETERVFTQVENTIRATVPHEELASILDNIGLPVSGLNLLYSDSGVIGPSDGEILVSLNAEKHGSTWGYVKRLRAKLHAEHPDVTFFFQPADIVSQILNFGLPAPIDVQVTGRNQAANYQIAKLIERQIARIPGTADVHLHQVVDSPELRLNVDRTRASGLGLTQRDVANSVLISLSSSSQVSPNFWLNPKNGVNYNLAVQTPQYKIDSIDTLESTPVNSSLVPTPQLLGNMATIQRGTAMAVINHYNVQPVYDIYANVQDRDLGGVAGDIDRVVKQFEPKLPRGSFLVARGQLESMKSSFLGLGAGLVFAILLVYFLMVVNFQSWLDPFIIMMAVPGALSGILLALFVTQTTVSVPAMMGAIMSIGVGTANSILLVTFANKQREGGDSSTQAALTAGYTRLRPVMMTALAMIIGMLPMSLGLGEGGEQNAPLGRAVIGGLSVATFATLFFVPVVYSVLRRKERAPLEEID